MLTKQPVRATYDGLGCELPHVDLTKDLTRGEVELIKQASDDAGGIVVTELSGARISQNLNITF